jgi:hypothetical protein
MAVDMIARMMALDAAQQGGTGDAYTKAETDELLDGKADLVDGLIPVSQIPPVVIERLVKVADDTARFALTTATVQNGDTVQTIDNNKMYAVIDDTHLDSEQGYQVYVAGMAARAVGDQNGNTIDTTYATKATTKTAWEGTAAQYAALTSDDYDLYFVEEST